MSQLKTNSITNIGNTGDANIVLGANGDTQVQSLNGSYLAGFRNQLINGDFRVWQRGSVITTGDWGADRWAHGSTGTTVSEWRHRLNGNVPECPVAAEITSTGATGDYIIQSVELPAAGNAGPFGIGSTWTLSFWANVDMISNWNQSHCLQFRDGTDAANNITNAVSGGNSAPVVIQTSTSDSNWKKYAISGLTIDTAPSGSNLCLNVRLKLPTSAVRIGQIQLEPGPVATPFEQRPIGLELSLCQRYYQKISGPEFTKIGLVTIAASSSFVQVPTPVSLRANPTISFNSLSLAIDTVGVSDANIQSSRLGTNGISIDFNNTFGRAKYSSDALQVNSGGSLAADAEL